MKIENLGLLKQLGYSEDNLKELNAVKQNTPNFEKIKNHLVSLNDKLKHLNGFIAFSNSVPHLKIKVENSGELLEEAKEIIEKWAKKYNVILEKVKENVFYIKKVN
ncbi:conserved hypothetical protein [Lebetimonas natsushimae]|uniref:Uncharacterized protein n=1 Tax=Lebetimonas natsushimae TaxID=1936991 RepID=A0A292YAS3_9BACT|nr:hypothetical protein [Lebetimonas natsushimae]GAX87167.1 conserved hypothetical protein [Lebetimonas natsushimae]